MNSVFIGFFFLIFFFRFKAVQTRYPKTPDLDIINGVHVIRSLHVKNDNINKFGNPTNNSVSNVSADFKESKKPTWLVFDKQVRVNDCR